MSKTNKLRGENYLRRFIRETQTYDGDLWMRVSDVAKAIKEAKSQWKQEALKAIDKIDDSSIEVKQGDSYLKKGTVGTSGIVDKVTITTSDVKEKCKKAITDL